VSAHNISFEFFPPATPEGRMKWVSTFQQLRQFSPAFFSVTYGAGGSTRDRTAELVSTIQQEKASAAPHLSCIGSSKESIRELLMHYREQGIRQIVALRGDLPSGMADPGEFHYATELVRFIREEMGDWFEIHVAAYPEYHPDARSAEQDLLCFRDKMQAGAHTAITQYFYSIEAYWSFCDAVASLGVSAPIIPGIMPIASFSKLSRFSEACGAEIPRWIRKKMEGYGDDLASVRAFGLDVVTHLCDDLLNGGAPGLHFYTLNQAGLTSTICQRLGL
jgi:methylenetetrahydrofolate reductase (NADPH)